MFSWLLFFTFVILKIPQANTEFSRKEGESLWHRANTPAAGLDSTGVKLQKFIWASRPYNDPNKKQEGVLQHHASKNKIVFV